MLKDTEAKQIMAEYVSLAVTDQSGSSAMGAYLARPAEAGNYPGVVVAFELFGLTEYIRSAVEHLAQFGYVVIAPDFHHRTAPGVELEGTEQGRARGFELLHQMTREQAVADVRATMSYLRDAWHCTDIGMVGFSAGGHLAYLAATQLDLKATVVFYAGWLTTQDIPLSRPTPTLELTPGIAQHNGYLLFLVGDQDMLISAEQREHIEQALEDAGVRHELVAYAGAPHAFLFEGRQSYHKDAADDAWKRIRELFATELAR